MKRVVILCVICLLMITIISVEIYATGLSLTGIGGRATVFGGAFRGLANDWSAAYWNPAGMVQVQRFQLGGDVEYIKPSASFMPARLAGENFSVAYGSVDGEDLQFIVPAGGFVYSTGKMAFGLSVFAPFGLGTEWNIFNTQNYNTNYPPLDYDDNLTILDIHPTFAYQVSDKLSIGVGVSFLYTDIVIQMPRMTPNPLFYNPLLEPIRQVGDLVEISA